MITVEELNYRYPGRQGFAVDGISFAVEEGEVFGFLGPNGAGKSTTQKILIGLLEHYEGHVSILGRRLQEWDRDVYRQIGVAFEFPNHFTKLTGRENLRYFGGLYSPEARRAETIDDLLERLDLSSAADIRVGQYSKGMATRLSIARALLHDPRLIFLDEPTGGLDPAGARLIKNLVRQQRRAGKSVFLTTHDMAVATELCDRVAFLVDGRIALVGRPHDLALEYGQPIVRVEVADERGVIREQDFELATLADDRDFQRLLHDEQILTIHSQEATLEDVFIEVTGRKLR